MDFQREAYSAALVEEMLPLFEAHWQEIAHYKDIPLEPDLAVYEASDRAGILRVFTARKEGTLHGYIVFFVRSNPHYKSSIQASQDILFLSQPMRQGLTGYRFIQWCDDQLAIDGVQAVYHHVKGARDFGPVLERMGYEAVDIIYARRLK